MRQHSKLQSCSQRKRTQQLVIWSAFLCHHEHRIYEL